MVGNEFGWGDRSYQEHKDGWETGFRRQGDANFFLGLDALHELSPFESERPISIEFQVMYMDIDWNIDRIFNITCFDVVFKGEEDDYQMHMAGEEYCYGSPELSAADVLYHTQVGFSTKDHDVDLHEETNLAYEEIGGWWHRRERRMNPLGTNPEMGNSLIFKSYSEEVAYAVYINLHQYKCPSGTYGKYCNFRCTDEYCQNGGICAKAPNDLTIVEEVPGLRCICPDGFFGRLCQYTCPHGDLEKCLEDDINAGQECTPLIIRRGDSESFDKTILDFETGFGALDLDYWAGFNRIHHFLDRKTGVDDFSTIEFEVDFAGKTYKKSCVDFVLGSKEEGYKIDLGQCFGDVELSDENIHFMKQSKFSTKDVDYSDYDCAVSNNAGWWYHSNHCHKILPTGLFVGGNPNEKMIFFSLTGLSSAVGLQINICNNYVKRTCENLVKHQQDIVEFDQPLKKYSAGFGDCKKGDCFNGLEYMSSISNQFVMLDMEFDVGYSGESYNAKCKARIGDKTSGYALEIMDETCVRDNELSRSNILFHDGMRFTAPSSANATCTNDCEGESQCAIENESGWWYSDDVNQCYQVLPTGKYGEKMKFESLNQVNDDTVSRFNIDLCGNIKDRSGNAEAEQFAGKTCKKVLTRYDGSLSFERVYGDFVKGFGDCETHGEECWIGLETLNSLTRTPKKLIIEVSHQEETHVLGCLDFALELTDTDEYKFDLSSCYGSSALSRRMLKNQRGKAFSTDNACAQNTRTGWFYDESCGGFLPTGEYGNPEREGAGIHYESLTGLDDSAETMEISICGEFEEDIEQLGCHTFLSRVDGEIPFDRTYAEYVQGFGDPVEGEGWLGLETLHKMTEIPQKLQIRYTYEDGDEREINCGIFFVEGAEEEYKVHFEYCEEGEFDDEETLVPDFMYHNGARFSTYDHPLEKIIDETDRTCAIDTEAGFWYQTTGDCHKFHPTGEYGSTDYKKGINFGGLKGLSSVKMSVCRVRKETSKPQDFGGIHTRSCSKDCEIYQNSYYELKKGEQMFLFQNENYLQSGTHFRDVHTGPKKDFRLGAGTSSFYSTKIRWPVVFLEENFEYINQVGLPSQMMYLKETCPKIADCGWGETPLTPTDTSFRIGSAYIPTGFQVTFYEEELEDMTETTGTYNMGGNTFDRSINFRTWSWVIKQESGPVEAQEYPVLFQDTHLATNPRVLRYNCDSNCQVSNHRSLYVPNSYIVELFSQIGYTGVTRKFVGPISIESIDGYFSTNQILSYKSTFNVIKSVDVHLEFFLDEATVIESSETNINELVVSNPSKHLRELTFEDTYIVYDEKDWEKSGLVIDGESNNTMTNVLIDHMWDIKATMTISAEVSASVHAEGGVGNPLVYAKGRVSAGVTVGLELEMGGGYTYQDKREYTDTVDLFVEKIQGKTDTFVKAKSEKKSFTYQCVALPYTITTCQAKQTEGIYNIPYVATKTITYTDGRPQDIIPEPGNLENAFATRVYFGIVEQKLSGVCREGFDEFNGDCYLGVKMATDEDLEKLRAGEINHSQINYLEMSLEDADKMCYMQKGADLSSIHGKMENYQAHKQCSFDTPILIGVKYLVASDEHVNVDGSPFDYSRFAPGTSKPTKDSYVVINDDGMWEYIHEDHSPVAKCAVCKKDLNIQLML